MALVSMYPLMVTGGFSGLAGFETEIGPAWELEDDASPAQPVRRTANATRTPTAWLAFIDGNVPSRGADGKAEKAPTLFSVSTQLAA